MSNVLLLRSNMKITDVCNYNYLLNQDYIEKNIILDNTMISAKMKCLI